MKIRAFLYTLFILSVINANAQKKITYSVDKAGTLITQMTQQGADSIVYLTVTGKINAIDFRHLRDEFKHLEILDLSGASIKMYVGKEGTDFGKLSIYKPDYIPKFAFCRLDDKGTLIGKSTLHRVILPYSIKSIDLAAFKGCNNLEILQLNNQNAIHLGDDALSDTITTIFVPTATTDQFRRSDTWHKFSLLEGEPLSVKVQISKMSSLRNELQNANIQPGNINFLTIEGKLDDDDFLLIRNYMAKLVHLDISNTNTETIPDYTFSQKKNLVHIDLPKGLKKIGQRAFSGCTKLGGTLYIPSQVSAIDYGAFIDCEHLTRVKVNGNKLTAVGDNLFGTEKNKLIFK